MANSISLPPFHFLTLFLLSVLFPLPPFLPFSFHKWLYHRHLPTCFSVNMDFSFFFLFNLGPQPWDIKSHMHGRPPSLLTLSGNILTDTLDNYPHYYVFVHFRSSQTDNEEYPSQKWQGWKTLAHFTKWKTMIRRGFMMWNSSPITLINKTLLLGEWGWDRKTRRLWGHEAV